MSLSLSSSFQSFDRQALVLSITSHRFRGKAMTEVGTTQGGYRLTKYTKHGRTQGGRKQEVNPKGRNGKNPKQRKNQTRGENDRLWGDLA